MRSMIYTQMQNITVSSCLGYGWPMAEQVYAATNGTTQKVGSASMIVALFAQVQITSWAGN